MKKQKQIRSNWMFYICAAVTASAGWFGLVNTKPVLAAENDGEEMVVNNVDADDGAEADVDATGELSENALNTGVDKNLGVYDFKDNKTTGTVTVTKVWDDDKTNEERAIPDIKISTEKPSKSTLGYTVTFHSNGAYFADNTVENQVLYNSSGKIISGNYKTGIGIKSWYYDKECTQQFNVNEDGTLPSDVILNNDIDVYAKLPTFNIVAHDDRGNESGSTFHNLIPEDTTKIIFCNELMPKNAEVIDGVDEDGDGGVVSWMEGTVMKVSTQIENQKVKVCGEARDLFEYKKKLEAIDFTNFDTSELTSMCYWFANDIVLNDVDISNLDLKNVKDMSYMFMYGGGPELDFKLNDLYLPNLEKAGHMFSRTNARSVDLSGLNCPNAGAMDYMFAYSDNIETIKMDNFKAPKSEIGYFFAFECKKLEYCSMKNVDLSGMKNMHSAFYECKQLTGKNLNMDGLDWSSLENIDSMFAYCTNLTSVSFIKGVKHFGGKSSTLSVGNLFNNCTSLTTADFEDAYFEGITNMNYIFNNCTSLSAVNMDNAKFPALTSMENPFMGCKKLKTITGINSNFLNLKSAQKMFSGINNIISINLRNANFKNVENAFDMFYNKPLLATINLEGVKFDSLQNASYMFSDCSTLENIDISGINFQNVKNIQNMFARCSKLKHVDFSNMDIRNVQTANSLCYQCTSLIEADMSNINASSLTDAGFMFSGCTSLETVNLYKANLNNAQNLYSMFYDCKKLTTVNMDGVIAGNIQNTGSMFYGCLVLESINLSSISTETITYMYQTFYNCESLKNIDISGLSTNNVTNFSNMFAGCNNLKTLNAHIDTSSAKTLSNMFDSCYLLDQLDTSGFNTLNVTDMFALFADCKSLTKIDLSTFSTDKVTDMGYMFYGCESLSSLDVSLFNTENVTSMENMFINCNSLASLKTGKDFKFIGTNYSLSGTWQNTAGETFTSGNFPSNVADTYTKISN